ncbi:MAG: VTC domain-containing protein [Candidatus Lokiarchaeota archaeon]|nr:VTC domain-containing protein [Candidatus Lokiarchaeota archaeon]
MSLKQKYFNRFEIKYKISIPERDNIINHISPFMKLDPHVAEGYNNYEVRSIYYDSPLKRAYHEKIHGDKVRVKLRIRFYPSFSNDENKLVFIELKRKMNENVSKSRVIAPLEDAAAIVDSNTSEAQTFYNTLSKEDQLILENIWYLYKRYALRPVCVVSYFRRPYVSRTEGGRFRITFDTNVKVRNYNFDLKEGYGNKYVVPPQICVMEVKFTSFIPEWAVRIVQRNNVIQEKMSKFASGLRKARIISIR